MVAGWAVSAVIPAAGLGTRFMPFTGTVPKELLPIGGKPIIELVIEEAACAGAEQVILVTAESKNTLVRHLRSCRDASDAAAPMWPPILTVPQLAPKGLGHAVACAESCLPPHENQFMVLLPDLLLLPLGVQERMRAVQEEKGGIVLAGCHVDSESVCQYGVFDTLDTDHEDVKVIRDLVEKPSRQEAPSNLVISGRYLLDRNIFTALRETPPGRGGEIQLTDAMRKLVKQGHPAHVVIHRGPFYDVGDPVKYLQTLVEIELGNDHRGAVFREWLEIKLAANRTRRQDGSGKSTV